MVSRLRAVLSNNALPILLKVNRMIRFFFFSVSTILGIPTVRRPAQSYLLSTLNDLIYKMSPQEKADSLIVVLIAEVSIRSTVDLIMFKYYASTSKLNEISLSLPPPPSFH